MRSFYCCRVIFFTNGSSLTISIPTVPMEWPTSTHLVGDGPATEQFSASSPPCSAATAAAAVAAQAPPPGSRPTSNCWEITSPAASHPLVAARKRGSPQEHRIRKNVRERGEFYFLCTYFDGFEYLACVRELRCVDDVRTLYSWRGG